MITIHFHNSHTGQRTPAFFDDCDLERFTDAGWKAHAYGQRTYIRRRAGKRHELAHRIVMGCQEGDGTVVDHIDGNPLNNQRANLRLVTVAQNSWNQSRNSKTGFTGVQQISPGLYVGKVRTAGGYTYAGSHSTAIEAAKAVNVILLAERGPHAKLNIIDLEDLYNSLLKGRDALLAQLMCAEDEIADLEARMLKKTAHK